MPITQINSVAALVVIDLQKGIVGLDTAHPTADIVAASVRLADAFRSAGLPVIWVNVEGRAPGRVDQTFAFSPPADWADLVPELGVQPEDERVTKFQIGAFYGTPLERVLRRRGVTQVVLTGIATGSGVEATARTAYDHGFNVVAVTDAMTDMSADTHAFVTTRVFPRIAETGTTEDVLALLAKR